MEVQLLRAQGNNLGADSAQRAIDIAGYDAAAIAIYDYNAAIRKQIEELEKAKEASQAAIDNLGRLASKVSTTFNSLENAGTLLDKIGSALGLGAGTYAAEKEKAPPVALDKILTVYYNAVCMGGSCPMGAIPPATATAACATRPA